MLIVCVNSKIGESKINNLISAGVTSKNPLVLRNFLLVPKYFSHCISFGQVVNTTISYSKCNSNQTDVDEGSSDIIFRLLFSVTKENITY